MNHELFQAVQSRDSEMLARMAGGGRDQAKVINSDAYKRKARGSSLQRLSTRFTSWLANDQQAQPSLTACSNSVNVR